MKKKIKGAGAALLGLLLTGLVLLLPGCTGSPAEQLPAHTEQFFVNDFAGILSDEDEKAVFQMGVGLQEATTAQVVLVTVEDTGTRDLESFSRDLAREWGIGQKDKDNGVLLLFTVDGPHSRIEVGYGLEGAINDSKAGRILDTYLVPWYNDKEAYSPRLKDTYTAIINEVYAEYGMTEHLTPLVQPEQESSVGENIMMIIALIIIVLLIISTKGRILFIGGGGYHSGGGGGGGGGFSGGGGGFGGGGASR